MKSFQCFMYLTEAKLIHSKNPHSCWSGYPSWIFSSHVHLQNTGLSTIKFISLINSFTHAQTHARAHYTIYIQYQCYFIEYFFQVLNITSKLINTRSRPYVLAAKKCLVYRDDTFHGASRSTRNLLILSVAINSELKTIFCAWIEAIFDNEEIL